MDQICTNYFGEASNAAGKTPGHWPGVLHRTESKVLELDGSATQ
jgi:hypothetical protein